MISKLSKIHQNTFSGGLNKDYNKSLVESDKYFDAQNLSLVESNKFLSLQNIKGTTNVQSIIGTANTIVLGVFSNLYDIDGVSKKCLTIFTATDSTDFRIYCYDTEEVALYQIFTETISSDYITDDRTIDAICYPENGLDILYFTDNYNEIRKLRCKIPNPSLNFLTKYDLSLQRFGALGIPKLANISTGGSLLSGSYEFSYQLINPDTKKYSKFSLLSLPIKVYSSKNELDSGGITTGGVGATTPFKISIDIDLGLNEDTEYTHFRLAVVENIYPEGTTTLTAQLTPIEALSDYLTGTTITGYEYRTNIKLEQTQLSEIVVDLAAIDYVKTLAIRQNRLMAGNITYKNLVNDKTQTVSGNILKRGYYNGNTGEDEQYLDPFSNHIFASKYTGYFRDEVYRFAISYFDEFGNFSPPKAISMEDIQDNRIYYTGIGANLFDNGTFTGSLTSWLQTGVGTAWTSSGNTALANLTVGLVEHSQILYQNISDISDTIMVIAYDVTANSGSGDLTIVMLNGTTVVTAFAADDSVGSHTQQIIVPSGVTGIGFKYVSGVSPGSVNIDNVSAKLTSESIDGLYDMKFPKRSDVLNGNRYTLFADDKNGLQSLGLQLNIDNHPTWAKGFVVLRAKRIEDIVFQTPLLPCMKIQGTGALEKYPTTANEGKPSNEVIYSSASPMEPEVVIAPPQYFWGKPVDIIKNTVETGSDEVRHIIGESYLTYPATYTPPLWMIFPDSSMYTQNSRFNFTDGLYLSTIDAAACRYTFLEDNNFTRAGYDDGTYSDYSCSMTIWALRDGDYYYDSAHNGSKTSIAFENKLTGYTFFDNFSEGTTLKGYNVFTFDKLQSQGFSFGTKPNVQKSGVISLEDTKETLNRANSLVFASSPSFVSMPSEVNYALETVPSATNCVDTIEICNVVKRLADDRYGKANYPHEFISTGTIYNFTESELEDVEAETSVPITVDVWGGDCTVSSHFFRITDSIYTVTNQFKYQTVPVISDRADQIFRWGKSFETFNTQPIDRSQVSMPIGLRIANQSIQIVLESKFNGEVMDIDNIVKGDTVTDGTGMPPSPHQIKLISTSTKTPLTYNYNINFNVQPDKKVFLMVDPLIPVNDQLKARLIFSDEKIYQTNIEGFDIFRVLNYHDLEETYGGITKLSVVGDDLFSIQEDAITYIGVGERVLETTTADSLTVKSGEIIGNTIFLSNSRGGQHLKGIINTGNNLYVPDNKRKAIYKIADKSIEIVSDIGMASEWRSKFASEIPERYMVSLYDPVRKEAIFSSFNSPYCYVFNELLNCWVSNYGFSEENVLGGVYSNQKLYLVGRGIDTNSIDIHEMYTGPNSYLMGTYVDPQVKILVNPDMGIGKVFDDILLNASDRLYQMDILVERESTLGNQTISGIDLDISSRGEGNFRTKALRVTGTSARPRGNLAVLTFHWDSQVDALQVSLASTVTKYRLSENIF